MNTFRSIVLIAAVVAAGLQAGTYYVWACAVIPGVARADDHTFVTAINHMNHAIVNPVFMLTFLGTPVLAAAAAVLATPSSRPWAVVALALAIATVVVTFAANIPLNNALDTGAHHPASARAAFETAWQWWNALRVLTSTGALIGLAGALLRA
ncbi:DUF1772 domain-containing protein [Galbitalea sp. SE-J8]|uniref:anthrone oxygenase family protein n=1 Tax=Galbitalea sp. SE-J8 TaxID=3054952 RepID=UPI00259CC410|nr:anthrone oxygenase family protein [Galbitalea sp. SE-J8]MDM4761713.1 DUF1772 domain-containing protein [Galbitalea sp. SE-J8]